MEKFIISSAFAAMAAVAGYTFLGKSSTDNASTSDVLSLNVEAIASGESSTPPCTGPKDFGYCHSSNGMPCKDLLGCQ